MSVARPSTAPVPRTHSEATTVAPERISLNRRGRSGRRPVATTKARRCRPCLPTKDCCNGLGRSSTCRQPPCDDKVNERQDCVKIQIHSAKRSLLHRHTHALGSHIGLCIPCGDASFCAVKSLFGILWRGFVGWYETSLVQQFHQHFFFFLVHLKLLLFVLQLGLHVF